MSLQHKQKLKIKERKINNVDKARVSPILKIEKHPLVLRNLNRKKYKVSHGFQSKCLPISSPKSLLI